MGAVNERMKSQSVLAVLIGLYVCTLHGTPLDPTAQLSWLLPSWQDFFSCGKKCGINGSGVCLNTKELEFVWGKYQPIPGNCSGQCSCFKRQKGSGRRNLEESRIARAAEYNRHRCEDLCLCKNVGGKFLLECPSHAYLNCQFVTYCDFKRSIVVL